MKAPEKLKTKHTTALTYDVKLLFPVLFLVGIGIVMIYSASSTLALKKFGNEYFFFKKQAIFAMAGILVLVFYKHIPYRIFQPLTYPILVIAIVLLAATLFSSFGYSVGGSKRWLRYGGFSIQPSEFVRFANEGLILELLGILDNFERGIKSAEHKKDYELLHQGVDMISKQLHSLLEEKGLVRIKSLNKKFDPHQHEAVEVVEDPMAEENTIIEEMQPGYILNGRIIRPVKVKVAKAKEEAVKTETEEEKEQVKEEEIIEEEESPD